MITLVNGDRVHEKIGLKGRNQLRTSQAQQKEEKNVTYRLLLETYKESVVQDNRTNEDMSMIEKDQV